MTMTPEQIALHRSKELIDALWNDGEVGKKIATDMIPRWIPTRPGVHYAEDSTWYSALEFAKLTNDQQDSDPKQRAIDDANAEVTAYQQAAATFGISEAAKQQFIERTQQAETASINAVRAAGVTIADITTEDPDLEDVFLALTYGDTSRVDPTRD